MADFRRGLVGVLLAALVALPAYPAAAAVHSLTFYSTVPRNFSDALVKEFLARNPGIQVDTFEAGVEIVLAKIELEIRAYGRPKADVVWIQDPTAMERLVKGGFLERYVPKDAGPIMPVYREPQGYWTGILVTHALLMRNTQAVPASGAPKRWKDLAAPRFNGKVILADPRISGVGAAVVAALAERYGWKFWEDVAKNHPLMVPSHSTMVSLVIGGERHIGPMVDFSIFGAVRKQQPIAFIFPEEGALAIGGYVGIVRGTSELDTTQRFVDYFSSKDAAAVMRSLGMYSTRTDIAPPEGWPSNEQIKLLSFSWEAFGRNLADIKKRFTGIMHL